MYIEDSKREEKPNKRLANYNDDLLFLGCCYVYCLTILPIPERNPVNIAAAFIVVCWPYWSIHILYTIAYRHRQTKETEKVLSSFDHLLLLATETKKKMT